MRPGSDRSAFARSHILSDLSRDESGPEQDWTWDEDRVYTAMLSVAMEKCGRLCGSNGICMASYSRKEGALFLVLFHQTFLAATFVYLSHFSYSPPGTIIPSFLEVAS